jgi:two-component sensor histidine kinase/PAS domain-containing protein
VPTPGELAQYHTSLKPDELDHLQRLLGSWSLLADLSFSDLLLLVPTSGAPAGTPPHLVVLGQIRPNNRPTLVGEDFVGQTVAAPDWPLCTQALHSGEIVAGVADKVVAGAVLPVENIPVRFHDRVLAVVVRVCQSQQLTPESDYERTYLDLFRRLSLMVTRSAFPFPAEDVGTEETPRVGDGVVVVDREGRVVFASPNAVNAFHRLGVFTSPEGRRFADLGVEDVAVERALSTGSPIVEEVERRPNVSVLVHCIPLLDNKTITGAMVLLRDVTDVRRLDRLLLSKDAAIREVHHRVKNNLQTISSLLHLQARRAGAGAGRQALLEAERRVRSIAIVHEILSRDPGDQVPFDEIVGAIVQMAKDSVVSARPVEITVAGEVGEVGADVATPLAVAMAEVLQNAVEHAFEPESRGLRLPGTRSARPTDKGAPGSRGEKRRKAEAGTVGRVTVGLEHDPAMVRVTVRDDGIGLPRGFDIERTSSLGLSIVRDLVVSQLGGSIDMSRVPRSAGGGTRVSIEVPLSTPH